jgi:hypothetical protein
LRERGKEKQPNLTIGQEGRPVLLLENILFGLAALSYSLKAHDEVNEDGGDDQMRCGELSPARALR